MTDDELERMRAYVHAAREHPTWSVAYAQDVPKLLAALEVHRTNAKGWAVDGAQLHHRLRWLEMICDQEDLHTDVNGEKVPWRQAARLNEALEGEPVTEPVAKSPGTGVQSTD